MSQRDLHGDLVEHDAGHVGRDCQRVLLLAILLAFFAAFGCAPASPRRAGDAYPAVAASSAAAPAPTARVRVVGAIGMTVADLDRSVAFYTAVLGFEPVGEDELAGAGVGRSAGVADVHARRARLRLGDEALELTAYAAPKGRAVPTDSRSNDGWFQHVAIIVADMGRAYARLQEHGVVATSIGGPQRIPDANPAAAGIEAYYFKDPDGHPLEILHFPPDKGAAKWHRDRRPPAVAAAGAGAAGAAPLFLGIDHTAIVVGDTDRSLAFYRDTLGLHVTGRSLNRGAEQEHLSGVPGARVQITSLHAAAGPGIELLEYRHPRTGRPMPQDERPTDVFHWQTRLLTSAAASRRSPAVLVRDPDGHVMELVGE